MSSSEVANKKPTIVEVDADEVNMDLDNGSSSSSSNGDIVVSGAHLFFYENGNLKQGRQITLTDLYEGELKAELSACPADSSNRVVLKMGFWIVNSEKAAQLNNTKTEAFAAGQKVLSWLFVGPQDIAGILWEDEEKELPVSYDDETKILTFEGSEFHLMSKSGPTKLEFE